MTEREPDYDSDSKTERPDCTGISEQKRNRANTREQIYETIRRDIGINFVEIGRRVGVPHATLGNHLDALEQSGMIRGFKVARFRRYFPDDGRPDIEYLTMGYLRDDSIRTTLRLLDERPTATLEQIGRSLGGLDPRSVSYRLQKLEQMGIIEKEREGRRCHYRVLKRNPKDVDY